MSFSAKCKPAIKRVQPPLWFRPVRKSEEHRIAVYTCPHLDGVSVAAAFGFEPGATDLTAAQLGQLRPIVKHFERYQYLEVFARDDRADADELSLDLSHERATKVREALAELGLLSGFLYGFACRALGEAYEAAEGVADDTESRGGRSVWVFAWPTHRAYSFGAVSNFGRMVAFGRHFGEAI